MATNQATDMPSEDTVRAALRSVIDPEVGMNVVDLGLVYGIEIAPNRVRVAMTMTTPACPMGAMITEDARDAIRDIAPDGTEIDVHLVWQPPWSPALMSDHAKQHFGWN
jgi:metal-sulfur cluster biosynthetic enzyme